MSSSIAIPAPPASAIDYEHRLVQSKAAASSSSSSSSSSSYSSSPNTPEPSGKSPSSRAAQKQKMLHSRRPSLLSQALQKQECTTINIADDPEGPPRLISYLSSSQGFIWNPEIFLPSYVDHDFVPLENRRDPVHEILLSDEEIKKIMPQ
ncbi:hypothetical protein B0T17DRAFT_617367 [Bombardia bombarda]|uniref:Uncharacterized protein n=1 Tax=Bombardia bombarda TaxID=252184 RepID=A0AA40C4N4_9PEZI|nr:hypothetical protein B0T17DRAFT_617367 [Bombardia bombarda]